MSWNYRRRDSDHGQPWHRPAHRAEVAGGAKSASVGAGLAVEWSRGLLPVCFVSPGGRNALCLLPGSVGWLWTSRPHLSDVHCDPHATWHRRIADRGDSGGGDVKPECRAKFAFIELDDRFLSSLPFIVASRNERSDTTAGGTARNRCLGGGVIRARSPRSAPRRTRG